MKLAFAKYSLRVFLCATMAMFGIFCSGVAGAQNNIPTIGRDLTVGSKGVDVQGLQRFLNDNGFKIASSGAGSPGHETTIFGYATKAALARFQSAHGISPASGSFGAKTRAFFSSLSSTGPNGSEAVGPTLDSNNKNELLRPQITALQQQLND